MADVSCILLGRKELLSSKLKAKRSGVWFKTLTRLDRALIDLTIKIADRVRSQGLTMALVKVLKKIEEALENKISQTIYRVGLPLARKIGLLAKKFGNPSAESWMRDLSFAKFLAIMYINSNKAHLRTVC
ncbi:MAG: hypothetical protein QHH17_08160 [Candidatus Bathyarchaeota archaeon]|jgi:uncharacterized protein YtpQ (UPF0354 family)|nr:hypothetical protein [Candidatus Bathyarchaeota archaeon]